MKYFVYLLLFFVSFQSLSQKKLTKIIDNCDLEKLQTYLEKEGDYNNLITITSGQGENLDFSLLSYAVGSECTAIVEFLISKEDKFDDWSRIVSEAFVFSLSRDNEEVSQMLYKILPNVRGVCDVCHGNSALMVASVYGKEDWYFKLKPESDLTFINNQEANLLHTAASSPSQKILEDVLTIKDIDLNAKNINGLTALDFAASNEDNPQAFETLINKGADVSQMWNLFYWWAQYPNTSITTKELEQRKADLWMVDEEGYIPLMYFAIFHYDYEDDMDPSELRDMLEKQLIYMLETFDQEKKDFKFNEFYYQQKINLSMLDVFFSIEDHVSNNPLLPKYLQLLGKAYAIDGFNTIAVKEYKIACKFYGKDKIDHWFNQYEIPFP
ncbi:MAG: ankyrin repeat domain-containing protein [Crocinitomicaceae bacterium]